MAASRNRSLVAVAATVGILAACGGGGTSEENTSSSAGSGATSSSNASSASSMASSASSATASASSTSSSESSSANNASSSVASSANSSSASSITLTTSSTSCPAIALAATDAASFTGDSTPLQTTDYHRENNAKILPFQVINKEHGYKYVAAPVMPTWQFASSDPTAGVLSALECDVAPDAGWHSYVRSSGTSSTITHQKVVVTGGRNAAKENIYTVYNGQQFIAALNEAGLKSKIIRVVGHIDLRYSNNNTTFTEYISYTDQKFGGSINIPSNTTIVGINDANGVPPRITGTTLLIGGELGTTTSVIAGANGDPQNDFGKWISAGKDGDLYPTWTRNIIMRNLRIDTPWDVDPEDSGNAYADGMTISRAQNIYLSNISMSDGDTPDSLGSDTRHDAAIDIVRGSDYVTLANTYIEKHHKTTLLGNGDSGRAWSDAGRLHATFTGMWWSGTESRLPLVRFGQLHSFNNLVEGDTNPSDSNRKFGGGLDVRYQADVLSENNYYQFTNLKPSQVGGKVSSGKDAISYRAYNEWFTNDKDNNSKAWATSYNGAVDITAALLADPALPFLTNWTPPYSYTPKAPDEACTWIRSNAGAGSGSTGRAYMPANTACVGLNTLVSSSSSSSSSSTASASSSAASSSSGTTSSSSSSDASSSSSSSGIGITYPWSDEFTTATTATLFTTGYATLPSDSTKALYVKTGGTITVDTTGVVTLNGGRFAIGALGTTATTSSSTPGGVFDIIGKSCTLNVNIAQASSGTGKFQVYVDNNTTSGGNSPHGSASVVANVVASTLVVGDNSFAWTLNNASFTSGSFIQLRTESNTVIYINSISLSCI